MAVVAVVAWAALLVVSRLWGVGVAAHAPGDLALGAMPLFGEWDLRLGGATVVLVVVGLVAVAALPGAARVPSWQAVALTGGLAAAGWALALGGVDGGRVIGESMQRDYGEHVHYVDDAGGPIAFLRQYTERQASYPVHLQAHPPGLPVLLWLGQRVGVEGGGAHVALALGGTAVAAVAALVALAEVAGTEAARRAMPFVALAPAAVWRINADAFFAGPTLMAVALVVVAAGRRGRRSPALAAAGGACFGGALLLTYGVALLSVPIAAVALWRRRLDVVAVAGAAGLAVLALVRVTGFSWWAGLAASRRQYDLSVAAIRPYHYFVVANLAVAALALGPAVAAGLARLRSRAAWVLVGGGATSLLLADLSGLSKSEVERIWQPFFPLLLLAAVGVATGRRTSRRWLLAQVALAVVVQSTLRSPW